MSRVYVLLGLLALSIFTWAQYKGYSLFDNVASGRSSSAAGARSIYHK